jgi:hypothetical protein
MMIRLFAVFILLAVLGGCQSLLPRGEAHSEGQWRSYREAQQTFDRITPYRTTVDDLRKMNLDPEANPNITLLNYSDVLRRFIPSPTLNPSDLDAGVLDCIKARTACIGYEVDQRVMKRKRYGSFWLDMLNFKRKTDISGWRFMGVILIRDGVAVYKLTGGQPAIHELEQTTNPLGPLQGLGESRLLR